MIDREELLSLVRAMLAGGQNPTSNEALVARAVSILKAADEVAPPLVVKSWEFARLLRRYADANFECGSLATDDDDDDDDDDDGYEDAANRADAAQFELVDYLRARGVFAG